MITLRKALAEFWLKLNRKGFPVLTIKKYMEWVERVYIACKKMDNWKEITSREIEAHIYGNKKWSDGTKRVYIVQVRAFLKFCRGMDWNVINPEQIAVRKYQQKEARYLTEEEELIVCTQLKEESLTLKASVLLMLRAGIRVEEACTLTKEQLSRAQLINGVYQIPIEGKGRKTRAIFMWKEVLEICKLRASRHKKRTVLGVETHEIQRIVRKFSKKVGIKFTSHTFRHTHITRLMQRGADLYKVQKIAGHTSIITTSRYLHTHNRELAETAKLVATMSY